MSRLRNQRDTRTPEYGRASDSELERNLSKAVEDSAARVGARVAAALANRMPANRMPSKLTNNA